MEIRCRCPGCATRFKVADKYAGKKARCPKCQAVVDVPLESTEPPSTKPPSTVVPPASKPGGRTVAIPVTRPASPAAAAAPSPTPESVTAAPQAASLATPPPEPAASPAAVDFPVFTVKSPARTDGPAAAAAAPAKSRSGKRRSPLPLILGGGGLIVAVVVAAIVALVATTGGDAAKSAKTVHPTPPPAGKGTLVLDWPQEQRSGGSLVIDGQKRPISAAGPLRFNLPPGSHKIVALRRGYQPHEATVTLALGGEEHLATQWKKLDTTASESSPFPIGAGATIAGFEGWGQMFDAAQRQAAQINKDLLIVFGCSDAQEETQRLARELAAAGVKDSHVCVIIDFPRTQQGYDQVADRGQNELLVEQFGIKSLPTLVLADDQGRAYSVQREWSSGFSGLAERLAEWSKAKPQRDALLAAARQGSESEQLAAAAKAVKWMQDKSVWRSYPDQIRGWLAAAQRVDPDNRQAVLEVFFEPQWLLDVVQINADDTAQVARMAEQLQPWTARKFHDPDRGAKLHVIAGAMLAGVERFDEATTQIEQAGKYEPQDAELAEQIQQLKSQLANKDLRSTGSGFLISSAGYVLTNHHVVDGGGRVEVRLYDQAAAVPAEVVATDKKRDVALLKIAPPPERFQPLALAAAEVGRGEAVAAFGYPLGSSLGSGLKLTDGSVSALPDPVNQNMYLLDIRVNRGNSGGPLCDSSGNVVGMIAAKFSGGSVDDSYAMSIPVTDLAKFIGQHLPKGTPLPALAAPRNTINWRQVDEQVQTGVVMVLNKKQ